ncbi:hypothetical protein BH23GEM2_BH23GEM2_19950 [soil metagenome]
MRSRVRDYADRARSAGNHDRVHPWLSPDRRRRTCGRRTRSRAQPCDRLHRERTGAARPLPRSGSRGGRTVCGRNSANWIHAPAEPPAVSHARRATRHSFRNAAGGDRSRSRSGQQHVRARKRRDYDADSRLTGPPVADAEPELLRLCGPCTAGLDEGRFAAERCLRCGRESAIQQFSDQRSGRALRERQYLARRTGQVRSARCGEGVPGARRSERCPLW